MSKKKVFNNCIFAISGSFEGKSQKDLEELITKHGGEVVASVSQRVTHLVSTKDDVKGKSSKVKKAEKEEIPIVSELFLTDSIEDKELKNEEEYSLREDDYIGKAVLHDGSSSDNDLPEGLDEDEFVEEDGDDKKPKKRKSSPAKKEPTTKRTKKESPKKETKPKKPKEPKKPLMNVEDFLKDAKPIPISVRPKGLRKDIMQVEALPRHFSTGSYGWSASGKVLKVNVPGKKDMTVQVGMNFIVRGSKPKVKKAEGEAEASQEVEEKTSQEESEPEDEWEDGGFTVVLDQDTPDLDIPCVADDVENSGLSPKEYQNQLLATSGDESQQSEENEESQSGWNCVLQ